MLNKKNKTIIIGISSFLILSGCSLHSPQKNLNTVKTPKKFINEGSSNKKSPGSQKWWLTFNDKVLNKIMNDVIEGNPDIEQALQRYNQSAAYTKQQKSYLYPEVSIGADAQSQKSSSTDSIVKTFELSAAASYEIDLWGKVRSAKNAAGFIQKASMYDLKAVYVSISARAAELYFQAVQKKEELKILKEIEEFKKSSLELAQLYYNEGIYDSSMVYSAKEELASASYDYSIELSNYKKIFYSLSVLQGKYPELPEQYSLPELYDVTEQFPKGLPSDLLKNRPDIQKAFASVKAADYQIGVAIANRFPSINLVAKISETGSDLTGSTETATLSSIAGSLLLPVLDWGRRKAEVKLKKASFKEKLAMLNQVILNGYRDAEEALTDYNTALITLKQLKLIQENADATDKQTKQKYINGVTGYDNVIKTHTMKLNADKNLSSAKLNLIIKNISIARAMGGTWMDASIEDKINS